MTLPQRPPVRLVRRLPNPRRAFSIPIARARAPRPGPMVGLLLAALLAPIQPSLAITNAPQAHARAPELAAQPPLADPPAALLVMTGRHSEVHTTRFELAHTQERFGELWQAHRGDAVERSAQGWPMPPRLDPDRVSALFLFAGKRFNSNGYVVEQILRKDDAIIVRINAITYQTSSLDGHDPGDVVHPWAVVLIDRPDRPLRIEENTQGLIGGEPIWTVRATFPAPDDPAPPPPAPMPPAALLDLAPQGQPVALNIPIADATYCWIDANPPEWSTEGLGIRFTDDPAERERIWAAVPRALRERLEVHSDVGGIQYVRTADGGSVAFACNESHQQTRPGRIRIDGHWHADPISGNPILIVSSITRH